MKHAREDYNRIQDPDEKIAEDEPVFLLRAKDPCSTAVIAAWADLAEQIGADAKLVENARDTVAAMLKWQRTHGFKVPDGPSNVITGQRSNIVPASRANARKVVEAMGDNAPEPVKA